MNKKNNNICPVEQSGSLDNKIRRWIQNPYKILKPYIREGMTVLDIGCGPGFFTIDMAEMVGSSGRVIASDMQEGMLSKLKSKIIGTKLEKRITLHKNEEHKIGITEKVDFILMFYMAHEVSNIEDFFIEVQTILKSDGQILIVEPPFHVSKAVFEQTIVKAYEADFKEIKRPKIFMNKAVVLKKA